VDSLTKFGEGLGGAATLSNREPFRGFFWYGPSTPMITDRYSDVECMQLHRSVSKFRQLLAAAYEAVAKGRRCWLFTTQALSDEVIGPP